MAKAKQTTTKAGTICENGATPTLPTRCATIDASVAKSANKLVDDSSICWDGCSSLTRSHHALLPSPKATQSGTKIAPSVPIATSPVARRVSVSESSGRSEP